jgi:S1-C subfamily serine protease
MDNNKEYETKKIQIDTTYDIALLENPKPEYTGIKIGDSSHYADSGAVKYKDPCIIIGSPNGTKNVVSFGQISGFMPVDDVWCICSTGDINPGNSGGALINGRDGTLIGIVSNLNFGVYNQFKESCAIPINDIKDLLK